MKADVRTRLAAHDEGRGRWRQLSHARQEAAGWRIDMHDLTDVEGVVSTVVDLAADHHLKLVVGEGSARSKDPTLRPRVEAVLREAFPPSGYVTGEITEHHPRRCRAGRWKPEGSL